MSSPALYTIGHSTRSLDEFLDCLVACRIELLADVRTIPRSRRYPHFNSESLAQSLSGNGMQYVHMKELGGLRKPRADSLNSGWRNDGFRGYADYMQTEMFHQAVLTLITQIEKSRLCLMCAEAVPWRCHRNLIADYLLMVHGLTAYHIISATAVNPHKPTAFARIRDSLLVYPSEGELPLVSQ